MNIAFDAMVFARQVHAEQKRKYSGNPYADHLAEVAGIVASVSLGYEYNDPWNITKVTAEAMIAIAWLHDCIEDQGVTHRILEDKFGSVVALGVLLLSDLETEGNRATRKAASRERLSKAPCWVQTIKCADLISNTSSIVLHDPKFAVTYLKEKQLLLDVLTKADPRLIAMALHTLP
jgi:(p)ppGpp synthase/HD superfamily hydrolase